MGTSLLLLVECFSELEFAVTMAAAEIESTQVTTKVVPVRLIMEDTDSSY